MAGEIEESIRHGFQVGAFDSFHSGSISFGRFESEDLCWERRSSFSHNRYLEEVEKCSKPGSVTEKKAYFEAQFRKRGILGNGITSSPESQNDSQKGENEIIEKTGYDEEINHAVMECGTLTYEAQSDISCENTDMAERADHTTHGDISEALVKENLDGESFNLDSSHLSNVTVSPFGDSDAVGETQRGSTFTEGIQSQDKYTKPKSAPRAGVAQSGNINNRPSKKLSERRAIVLVNKTKEASTQEKREIRKSIKNESGFQGKGDDDIKRSEKISRNRRIEEPLPSTLQMVSSRARKTENRINSAVVMSKPCVKQDDSRLTFKCNERAERMKEFQDKMHAKEAEMQQSMSKTQEKTDSEIKQLRKHLNFKATPVPSFCRASLHDLDRNKASANNVKPGKVRTKPSNTGSSRISSTARKDKTVFIGSPQKKIVDPQHLPQVSGSASCHSTVTSDSSPSISPSSEISKGPTSQAVINSHMRRKKENEKDTCRSLRKNKGPEVKKTGDEKQKKRTERSIHSTFTNDSRAGNKMIVRA